MTVDISRRENTVHPIRSLIILGCIYYLCVGSLAVMAFRPNSELWALTWWSYFSYPVKLTLTTLLVLAFPASAWLSRLKLWQSQKFAAAKTTRFALGGTIVLLSAAFFLVRTQTHFLGDGYTLLSSLAGDQATFMKIRNLGEVMIHRWIFNFMNGVGQPDALLTDRIVSVTSGITYLLLTAWFVTKVAENSGQRFLMFLALVSSGHLLLFF